MDDVKKYLAVLAKHSFWILSGLVLILSTVFFYLTRTSLDESIESRKSALKSTFGKIQTVEGKVVTHPNEFSHNNMKRLREVLKEDVDKAWDFQYARQKEFLTWPTEAFSQKKTYEIFDSLRPFEKMVPFPLPDKPPPPLDSITRTDRTVYKNYIAPEFPALARRIGSTWKYKVESTGAANAGGFAPPGGGGGFGGLGGPGGAGPGGFAPPGFGGGASSPTTPESRDLVRWSEESQKALSTAVLPWLQRTEPPNIHEIYYAQEDIWILRGLMDIIAKTNAGANENFQAIVKEIEWIRTGPRASRDVGTLWKAAPASTAGAGNMFGGGGGPPAGYGGGGGGGGGPPAGYGPGSPGKGGVGGGMTRAAQVDPADGRYVGADLKPLTGAQLRTAINERSKDGVAKRVQVRMRLKVDERFGKLITECGNGKMMLEVLQVRYNADAAPETASGSSASGLGGGLGMPGMPSGGPGGAPNIGGGGAGSDVGADEGGLSGAGSLLASAATAGEVSIEIYGLIYLFNPKPSSAEKKEGGDVASGAAAAAGSPPGATPQSANPANKPAQPEDAASAPPSDEPTGDVKPSASNPGENAPAGSPEMTEPGNPPPADPDMEPPKGENASQAGQQPADPTGAPPADGGGS